MEDKSKIEAMFRIMSIAIMMAIVPIATVMLAYSIPMWVSECKQEYENKHAILEEYLSACRESGGIPILGKSGWMENCVFPPRKCEQEEPK